LISISIDQLIDCMVRGELYYVVHMKIAPIVLARSLIASYNSKRKM